VSYNKLWKSNILKFYRIFVNNRVKNPPGLFFAIKLGRFIRHAFFICLQTFKLNSEKRKKYPFYEEKKFGRIDFWCQSILPTFYARGFFTAVQAALVIRGLGILGFAYSRFKNWYQNFPRFLAVFEGILVKIKHKLTPKCKYIQCSLVIHGFGIRGIFPDRNPRE
jgi:hypothetical protein